MTGKLEDLVPGAELIPPLPAALDARNRAPSTPEQQAKVAAAMAKAGRPQDAGSARLVEELREQEKRKRLIAKARREAPPPSTAMPLEGRAAFAAINQRSRPMAKLGPREQQLRDMRAVTGKSPGAATTKRAKPPAQSPAASAPAKPEEKSVMATTKTKTTAKKTKTKTKAKDAKPRKAPARASAAAKAPREGARQGTKLAIVRDLLLRPQGCTTAEVLAATGWPSVSMPQMAKAAGLTLSKEKEGKVTRYRATP